jgi:outer membrane protein
MPIPMTKQMFLLAALFAAGASHAETLALRQCVDIALAQNPSLMASQAQIAQAEGALQEAKGHRLPSLTASVNATRTNDALNAFGLKLSQRRASFNDFGAGEFNPMLGAAGLAVEPTNLNHPDAVTNYNKRLELMVPLYNGGMVSGYVDQAKAFVQAAQHGDQMARQQLIFQVVQAYEGVHTARAYETVTDQALDAAQAYVKASRDLLREGVIVKSDLLSAETNLADVEARREQTRRSEAAALDQLHLLLGLPLTQPLDVGPNYVPKRVVGDPEKMADEAAADNPGLVAMRYQLDAASASVKVAGADRYPHFNAMLRQDWNSPTLSDTTTPSYTVAGVLSWKILDFGVIRGAMNRAEAARTELAAKLKMTEDQIRFRVRDALRGQDEAEARVKWRQTALDKATEAQRLVQKRYQNGVATIVEVLATQAQLDKARADLVAARYELVMARVGLSLLLGRLDAEQM